MDCPNFYAYQLLSDNREINDRQKEVFFDRVNELFESEATKIYRGESAARLYQNYTSGSVEEFNSKFFLIGPKGNAFHRQQQNRMTIDENGDTTFTLIFDWLKEFVSGDLGDSKIKNQLQKFRLINKTFTAYFSLESNKELFLNQIRNLSENEQLRIRDYYLTLLHHNGDSDFYSQSFLLSVTKSFKISKRFAGNRQLHDDKVVVFGWVPREERKRILPNFRYIGYGRHLNQEPVVRHYNLPAYDRPLFINQREISLKGGLFVHHIFGYLHCRNNCQEFHINPAILESYGNWIEDGLTINQANFKNVLETTSLTGGYYSGRDNKYFEL